jgi:hypothetical protein
VILDANWQAESMASDAASFNQNPRLRKELQGNSKELIAVATADRLICAP